MFFSLYGGKAADSFFLMSYILQMKKIFCIAGLVSALLFTGCVTAPSGKEKVMTAYMQSGTLKYYIRPGKMAAENAKTDKAHIMIDFTYQMEKRNYVSDAYVNFTLHDKTNAFIETAQFLLPEDKAVRLSNISTLDRDVSKGYIRVTTVLEKELIKEVLEALQASAAALEVSLDDGSSKKFFVTKDLIERINEAFSK